MATASLQRLRVCALISMPLGQMRLAFQTALLSSSAIPANTFGALLLADAGRLPSGQGRWLGRSGELWGSALGNFSELEAGVCVDASVRISANQFISPRAGTAGVYSRAGGADCF